MHALARTLRRDLAARGLTPASAPAEAAAGRSEEATIVHAELVEGPELEAHPVGAAAPWPDPLAFLDGTQHVELLGYAGAAPLLFAELGAAVRERRRRRLRTVEVERRRLVVGRAAALDAAAFARSGVATVALDDAEPPHPVRDLVLARRAVDQARGMLEVAVAARYRAHADGWLVVDGSLAESPAWAADPRMVGVVKSHASLPFEGAALERYLRLPAAHRSSIFAPASRRLAPVRAWALRLWPWEGRDLFHGLIRVEVAPANGTPAIASQLSRWLLAERAPLSAPDPRWDRLLYGIRATERFLRHAPLPARA